jgi:hypothetical protein
MAETLTGEESWYMDNFKLPVHDTQKVRRNFAGVEDKKYMSLEELQEGDTKGMTETDEATSGQTDGPYTHIQEQTMGQKSRWPYKQSADGKRYNTEKPTGFGKLVF